MNSLIADVVDSRSCILFFFVVTIYHVSQLHCSDLHALSAMPMFKRKAIHANTTNGVNIGRISSEGKHTLDEVLPPPDNEGHDADCC